jgi:hypothetical protein
MEQNDCECCLHDVIVVSGQAATATALEPFQLLRGAKGADIVEAPAPNPVVSVFVRHWCTISSLEHRWNVPQDLNCLDQRHWQT